MYNNRSRGFTLIELLVVIAIIGILSAVVLASLNTARNKGNDAAVQSDLSTIQTEAEIYYGGTGVNSYGTANPSNTCAAVGTALSATSVFTDQTIEKAVAGADTANGTDATYGVVVCNSTPTAYAVGSGLQNGVGTNRYWCVDSTGNAKSESAALGTLTACQ